MCFERISRFFSLFFFAHSDTNHVTLEISFNLRSLVQDLLKEAFYTDYSRLFYRPFCSTASTGNEQAMFMNVKHLKLHFSLLLAQFSPSLLGKVLLGNCFFSLF